eukprot:15463659-Alexandrium_andersonii.AAC.1
MRVTAATSLSRMHSDLEPPPYRKGGIPKRRPEIADGPVGRCCRDDDRHARHLSCALRTRGRREEHYVAKARRPRHNRDTWVNPMSIRFYRAGHRPAARPETPTTSGRTSPITSSKRMCCRERGGRKRCGRIDASAKSAPA